MHFVLSKNSLSWHYVFLLAQMLLLSYDCNHLAVIYYFM